MALNEYKRKRNFKNTPEPEGKVFPKHGFSYVIQKHHARRLHYDFRLELDGVLKSWAIPKGPSLNPSDRRLAVEVEDHPLKYGTFEGDIPKGNYGAGHVVLWDRGKWKPLKDPKKALKKGSLEFELDGEKLKGKWHLVRMHTKDKKPQWLLLKEKDEAATKKYDITKKFPDSVNETPLEDLWTPEGRVKGKVKATPKLKTKNKTEKKIGLSINDIEIQLAKLVDVPPVGENWVHEIKYDGYRTITQLKNKKCHMYTRSHLDWTNKYDTLANEIKKLKIKSAWFDGEIVVLDDEGRSSFSQLQEVLKKKDHSKLVYYIFDLLELDGRDLRDLPLLERKAELKKILSKSKSKKLLFSDHFATSGGATLHASCKLGLEGIISKDITQGYVGGRGGEWIKSKCKNGQEFVIGGYSLSEKRHFRALLMGVNENGKLRYVGKVGTGFDAKNTKELLQKFKSIKTKDSPFDDSPSGKGVQWLKPQLIAEVEFRAWTADKILRQASFKGLRADKPAEEIVMETKAKKITKAKSKKNDDDLEYHLSNPDKVLIKEAKITKQNIADYYKQVEELMIAHLKERPLSLVRCPDGIDKECFFQKTVPEKGDDPIYSSPIKYKDSSIKAVNYIEDFPGLVALTQLGVLEIHNWGTHIDHYKNPDLIVFDLDPGPNVTLNEVRKGALLVKEILDQLKLKSFLKVSGGKGFHIHVPIEPIYDWDSVKNFSKAVAQQMADTHPDKYLVKMTKAKRSGKIFIDYLRNGFGATSIAPYSLRARASGAVALPIDWKDIGRVKPDQFKLKTVSQYLKKYKNPWAKYFATKQKIKILK